MAIKSGIYAIIHKETGRTYIGSSVNIHLRLGRHFRDLKKGVHDNSYLQAAWNKYGEDAFKSMVICIYSPEVLIMMEQRFVDILQPEFNLCKQMVTSALGVKRSEVTRQRMSIAATGREHNDKTKDKLRITSTGNTNALGYKYTDAQCRAASEARKGNTCALGHKLSDEAKERISKAKKGVPLSEEHKAKISMALQGNKNSNGMAAARLTRWNREG